MSKFIQLVQEARIIGSIAKTAAELSHDGTKSFPSLSQFVKSTEMGKKPSKSLQKKVRKTYGRMAMAFQDVSGRKVNPQNQDRDHIMRFRPITENWSFAHDYYSMSPNERSKYLFHVTTMANAKKILKKGLKPRGQGKKSTFYGLGKHTKGKTFVTNSRGVPYWEDQVEGAVNRGELNADMRKSVHILKFPFANMSKSTRRRIRIDTLGTRDSRNVTTISNDTEESPIDPSSFEAPTAFSLRKGIK